MSTRDARVSTRDARVSTRDARVSTRDARVSTRDARVSTRDSRVSTGDFVLSAVTFLQRVARVSPRLVNRAVTGTPVKKSPSEVRFGMKCDVNPKYWDVKTDKAAGRTADIVKTNALVDNTKTSVHGVYRELQERDNYVTVEKVKLTTSITTLGVILKFIFSPSAKVRPTR